MAIKKINRNQLNSKVEAARVVPTETVVEEQVTPVVEEVEIPEEVIEEDEEIPEEVIEEDEEIPEEVIEEDEEVIDEVTPKMVAKPVAVKTVAKPVTPKPVAKPVATKTVAPVAKPVAAKTNTNNGGNKVKKTLGKAPSKKIVTERSIGTVYPKDLLLKNIQDKLSEDFDISLVDTKKVMDAVEEAVMEACQVASVRFLGGIVKAQDRNALVAKAPKVDYHSYTSARKVITITGGELGQPDKYRGFPNEDGSEFNITEMLNHETGEWEAAEGSIELQK